jgi:hypothetical protein
MPWDQKAVEGYHLFAQKYVADYEQKIDCADLALAALIEYAASKALPVRLRYYKGKKWEWYVLARGSTGAPEFKDLAMQMLGALNVIDNTRQISLAKARPGDLIMSKWSGSLGHTRIIHSLEYDPASEDYLVIWYQGNLPAVVPEKKSGLFSQIEGVYEGKPRRWNFSQFDK